MLRASTKITGQTWPIRPGAPTSTNTTATSLTGKKVPVPRHAVNRGGNGQHRAVRRNLGGPFCRFAFLGGLPVRARPIPVKVFLEKIGNRQSTVLRLSRRF